MMNLGESFESTGTRTEYLLVLNVGNGWDMMGCWGWGYDLLIVWIILSKIPYV
jgi:hypothetical protein